MYALCLLRRRCVRAFAQEVPKSFKLHHAQLTRSLQLFSPGFVAVLPSVSYLLCTSRCATALRCDLVCQQFLEAVKAIWTFQVASSLPALAESWSQSQAGTHTKLHVSASVTSVTKAWSHRSEQRLPLNCQCWEPSCSWPVSRLRLLLDTFFLRASPQASHFTRAYSDLSVLHIGHRRSPTCCHTLPRRSLETQAHQLLPCCTRCSNMGNQLCSCVTVRAKSGMPRFGACSGSSGGHLRSSTSMLRLWSRLHCATLPREKGRLTTSQNMWSVVLTRVGSETCGETHHDGPRILLSGQDAPPATSNSAGLQRSGTAESMHVEDLRHSRSAQATGHTSQRTLPIVTGRMLDVPKAYPTQSRLALPPAMRCLPATQSLLCLTFELPLSELRRPLGLARTCSTTVSCRRGP